MATSKKFLDENGLSTLWNQIENNFISSDNIEVIINAIDTVKADKESPEFTGIPTAPTASPKTNTTQIATTEFVNTAISDAVFAAGGSAKIIITVTPIAGVTATLSNRTTGNTFTGSTDSNGVITINVNEFGVFDISYQSSGAVSSINNITVSTPGQVYQIQATYATSKTYTVEIDLSNSNPLSSVTYLDDAIGMTKGSSNWDNEIIFKDIKPCVFKDGSVVYYLDKTDCTKKVDGSTANLDGTDGDVMVEFPKFAYKIWKSNGKMYVSITNDSSVASQNDYKYYAFSKESEGDREHFYWGAFKGSLNSDGNLQSIAGKAPAASKTIGAFKQLAQNRGSGYTITSYFQLVALQCLYLIKYGNLNGQSALGQGISGRSGTSTDANYGPLVTGGTTTFDAGKKMYYGSTSNSGSSSDYNTAKLGHVKFAGIEDFWGNIWEWIDGLTTDNNFNIITNWDYDSNNYNNDFTTSSGLTTNSWGYVTDVAGTTESGFMNIKYGGSASTYFCDYGYLYSGRVLSFGGRWSSGSFCGPFYLDADDTASTAGAAVGARLMYL